jgi:hypothetical protein
MPSRLINKTLDRGLTSGETGRRWFACQQEGKRLGASSLCAVPPGTVAQVELEHFYSCLHNWWQSLKIEKEEHIWCGRLPCWFLTHSWADLHDSGRIRKQLSRAFKWYHTCGVGVKISVFPNSHRTVLLKSIRQGVWRVTQSSNSSIRQGSSGCVTSPKISSTHKNIPGVVANAQWLNGII